MIVFLGGRPLERLDGQGLESCSKSVSDSSESSESELIISFGSFLKGYQSNLVL